MLHSIDTTYEAVRKPAGDGRPIAPEYRRFATNWGFYKVVADLSDNKILDFDKVTARPVTEIFTFLLYQRDRRPAELAQSKLDRKWNKINPNSNANS